MEDGKGDGRSSPLDIWHLAFGIRLLPPVSFQFVVVDRDAEPRALENFKIAVAVDRKWFDREVLDVSTGRQVFDIARDRHGGGQLQIGSEADGRIPTVRD